MATASGKQVKRGFKVSCPLCGERHTLGVELDHVTLLRCRECDGEIDADELRGRLAEWATMLDWLSSAPAMGT